MSKCIYCLGSDGLFTAAEHPIPESLGNTAETLPVGVVCDRCNHGPLSVLDAAFLELAPVATMRVFNRVPRKGGALPEARLANARLTALTPGDVVIEPQGRRVLKQTDEGGGRVRVRMGLTGRRLTYEYIAQITRFLFKATLGFICFDHGPDRALDPALDEVRRIVLGEPFHGYLVAGNTAIPDQQIELTYDFIEVDGAPALPVWMSVFGVELGTELLVRRIVWRPATRDYTILEF